MPKARSISTIVVLIFSLSAIDQAVFCASVDDPAPLLAEAREIFERLGARPWRERVDGAERAVTV